MSRGSQSREGLGGNTGGDQTAGQPSPARALLSELRAHLGIPAEQALAGLTLADLRNMPQAQLTALGHKLGLDGEGVHGLGALFKKTKDRLADRVLEALHRLEALAGRAPEADDDAERLSARKFSVGEPTDPKMTAPLTELGRDIPWSYGADRVSAMPVDPDRLYCYWEVTDPAIAAARQKLGPAGAAAWLNVRVFDTTGRLFDGTNAHSYFDHGVGREVRQWFFHIGRPTSSAFVEVGLRAEDGRFVRIARSGRVDFPRREPVAPTTPEWLTVTSAGSVQHAGHGGPARPGQGSAGTFRGGEPAAANDGGGTPASGGDVVATDGRGWASLSFPWDEWSRSGEVLFDERFAWSALFTSEYWESFRSWTWEDGPHTVTSWEAGPFSYPVDVPAPSRETFEGQVHVYRVGNQTQIVYGPWEVVIKGIAGRRAKRTLARWEMHRSWRTDGFREVRGHVETAREPGGSSGAMRVGSSERVGGAMSELRLGGASEAWYLGASEIRLGGASELRFSGASEHTLRGGSERRLQAASEYRLGGASEVRLGGGSELAQRGASEGRLGGASERWLGGSSERQLGGASERSALSVTPPPQTASGFPAIPTAGGTKENG